MTPTDITGAVNGLIGDNKAVFLTVLGVVAGLSIGVALLKSGLSKVALQLGDVVDTSRPYGEGSGRTHPVDREGLDAEDRAEMRRQRARAKRLGLD